jgi:rare lipoprotein A
MPSPNNFRAGPAGAFAFAFLSLGGAGLLSGQMVNPRPPEPAKPKIEGVATWYAVPTKSIAKRRARTDELTAAHNRLPLGTRVRVTHLANGKNVVVRITDRGVYKRGTIIDLCKEAAEKLDMVREGSARVRVEVLPDDKLPTSKAAPPW